MTATLTLVRRRVGLFHPEWFTLALAAVAAAAWLMLERGAGSFQLAHGVHHGSSGAWTPGGALIAVGTGAAMGVAMTVAMMLPTSLAPIRYVAFASPRNRRIRAQAMYAAGFTAAWAPLVLVAVVVHLVAGAGGAIPAAVMIAVAAGAGAWELTPARVRAAGGCRRTLPIRRGREADLSCVRYGAFVGARCLISCGPLMAIVVVTGHDFIITGAAVVVTLLDKQAARPRGATRPKPWRVAAVTMIAAWAIVR